MRKFLFSSATLGRGGDVGVLVLRLGFAGSLALLHGFGKIERLLAGSVRFPDPLGLGSGLSLGLAGFAEFVCALAVLLGLVTRVASLPIVFTMAVAFFVHHGGDPMAEKELAFLYLIGFIGIAIAGPGRISIDAVISTGK